jgi:hypothetical protein
MRPNSDLRFFFEEAPLDLAAKSADLEVSSGATPTGLLPSHVSALPAHVIDTAARYRGIDEVVSRLSHQHQRILRAYYRPLLPRGEDTLRRSARVGWRRHRATR